MAHGHVTAPMYSSLPIISAVGVSHEQSNTTYRWLICWLCVEKPGMTTATLWAAGNGMPKARQCLPGKHMAALLSDHAM